MATRGYHTYRGSHTGRKIALAVILIVILIASLLFLRYQDYIVFDENGAHLELPQKTNTPVDGSTDGGGNTDQKPAENGNGDDLVINIEKPTNTVGEIHAVTLGTSVLTADSAATLAGIKEKGGDAFAIAMMLADGKLYYTSAVPDAAGASAQQDTKATIQALNNGEAYGIARLSCFRDDAYAAYHTDAVLKSGSGIWKDNNGDQWLSPYNPASKAYIIAIAKELAGLGFKEILLDNAFFPTGGSIGSISDEGTGLTKTQAIHQFFGELDAALKDYNVNLSVSVSTGALLKGGDETSGFDLATLPDCIDRVYVASGGYNMEQVNGAMTAARAGVDVNAAVVAVGKKAPASGSYLLANIG